MPAEVVAMGNHCGLGGLDHHQSSPGPGAMEHRRSSRQVQRPSQCAGAHRRRANSRVRVIDDGIVPCTRGPQNMHIHVGIYFPMCDLKGSMGYREIDLIGNTAGPT